MPHLTRALSFAAALAAIALCLMTFDLASGLASGAASQLLRKPEFLWGLFASHVPAAALGALGTGLVAWVGRFSSGFARIGSRAFVAATLCAYPAARLSASLTSGDWVKAQSFSSALRISLTLAILLGVAACSWVVVRLWGDRRALIGYAVGALGLSIVNATVLPGLYLEAHLALYVSSLLLLTWAILPEAGRSLRWASARASVPTLTLGALCLFACLYLPWMGMRTRADVLKQSTGIASTLSLVAPPLGSDHLERELARLHQSADDAEPKLAPNSDPPGKKPLSVLLVVVDTLRGDVLPPVRTGAKPFSVPAETPHLDAWIETTYRFKSAYAQSSQTKASMPAMFRSLEPFEDPLTTGVGLSDFARELGLRPVAVVPQYFLMPAQTTSQALLEGFEVVDFYTKDDQEAMSEKVGGVLDEVRGQPFLGWVHFYNMHSPYYAGAGALENAKSNAEKYRLALKWLDAQFGLLLTALRERGLLDSTLVILAADHGEHLGEGKRTGHGDGVHDEEIHVPLAFRVPGTKGGEVLALAGNLDIVPTVAHLFRRPSDKSHRGRSLVPEMRAGAQRSSRSLYSISGNGRVFGLVTQDYKLVYTPQVSTFNLYRRAEDPRDKVDIFGLDASLDRRMVSSFVRYHPALFAGELKKSEVRKRLAQRLAEVDPNRGRSSLPFLLKAAAATKDPEVHEKAQALYDRATSVHAKLTVSKHLGKKDAVWAKRWDELLAKVAGTPEESVVVGELAAQGAVSIKSAFAQKRLRKLANSKGPLLAEWLHLIAVWPKKASEYGEIFLQLLEDPEQLLQEGLLGPVLENVASLENVRGKLRKNLEAQVLPLTESEDVLVAALATEACRVSGGKSSVARMQQILDSEADPRLRQAALYTLRELRGAAALPYVIKASEDPLLLVDAIKLSADLGDPKAEPFLLEVADNHYNAWTRRQAKEALTRIKGRSKR